MALAVAATMLVHSAVADGTQGQQDTHGYAAEAATDRDAAQLVGGEQAAEASRGDAADGTAPRSEGGNEGGDVGGESVGSVDRAAGAAVVEKAAIHLSGSLHEGEDDESSADGTVADDDNGGGVGDDGYHDLSDENFEDFESVLHDLGERFDPSHVLTFSIDAGEVL
jgi:hypothetical protein